jgi:pyruvate,orthophosphate dikinase
MVPLVTTVREFFDQQKLIRGTAEKVFAEMNDRIDFHIGTMIETPRAALTAGYISQRAEFFSFGTNDLTQMSFGFSRDDAGRFLPEYLKKGLLDHEPFEQLDERGVGRLIQIAVEEGRERRPDLPIGICGEHGGNPPSIEFAHKVGLNYVSCSPFRVPIARLSAAQAALKDEDFQKKLEQSKAVVA